MGSVYEQTYQESLATPEKFWAEAAKKSIGTMSGIKYLMIVMGIIDGL